MRARHVSAIALRLVPCLLALGATIGEAWAGIGGGCGCGGGGDGGHPVPEPTTFGLFAAGIGAVLLYRRWRGPPE